MPICSIFHKRILLSCYQQACRIIITEIHVGTNILSVICRNCSTHKTGGWGMMPLSEVNGGKFV